MGVAARTTLTEERAGGVVPGKEGEVWVRHLCTGSQR